MSTEMLAVLEEPEPSEVQTSSQLRFTGARLSIAGLVSKDGFGPKQEERSPVVDQVQPQCPYIKEEAEEVCIKQEEGDIIAVTVTSEVKDKPDFVLFHHSCTEETSGGPVPGSSSRLDGCGTSGDQLVRKEEFPLEQQELSVTKNQKEQHHISIKEEEEELCIKQEDVDIMATALKSEDDEDKSKIDTHQTKDYISVPEAPESASMSEDEESSQTEDSEDDWKDTSVPTGLKRIHNVSDFSDGRCNIHKELVCDGSHLIQNGDSGEELLTSQAFRQQKYVGEHEESHANESPYRCCVCGKIFTQKSNLRMHKRIHTGEKPFSCLDCGKRFTNTSALKRHERIHTGEKPFSCSVCGKLFSLKTTLKNHAFIHTGEKPFRCFLCGRRFSRNSNLRTHQRIHTGERPYSCSVCDKKFKQRTNLQMHERTHTGEKPFSCSMCGKRFISKSKLKIHENTHR